MEIKPIVNEDFIVLKDDLTVAQMIGKLKNFDKRNGLVFRNKKYLGLIERKRLLKSRLDTSKAKIKNLVQKTPIITENADIIETANLMYQSNLKHVPVEFNKKIIGVLSGLALANLAMGLPETKTFKVKDIKLLKPTKINKDDKIASVISVMYEERLDQVPLFDKGKLSGIISFRDLLRRYLNWSPKRNFSARFNIFAKNRIGSGEMPNISSLPVSDFSTNENLITIGSDEKLEKAVELMNSNNIGDILVVEDDKFLGMLTVKNVLHKISSVKIIKNFNIKFIGLNKAKLQAYQKFNLRKIANQEAIKLQRKIKNEMNLTIHLKEHDKEGNRQKYSVHLKIEFPGQIMSTAQDDWDVETALRKTFNNAKNKVKNKFRGDSSHRKSYE